MPRIFQTHIPKKILLITLVGVISLLACMLAMLQEINQNAEKLQLEQVRTESLYKMYAKTDLEAGAAIVYDATNHKVLYARNASARLPLASISKVMTALVGRTVLPSTTPITINASARTEEPDFDLHPGDTWSAKDLTQYFLVKSSNDGATAVCNAVTNFIQEKNPSDNCISLMNRYAKNQGLLTLYFANPSGLDLANGNPSNFGSAYDVAQLLDIAYSSYPALFSATKEPVVTFTTNNYTYEAVNTDKVLDEIGTVLAGKTGYTDTAGGNLAVLYEPRPGLHVVIVVLGASHEGRFSDMLELVRRTNMYVRANQI